MDYLQKLSKERIKTLENYNFYHYQKLGVDEVIKGYVLPPIYWKWRVKNPYNKEKSLYGNGGVLDSKLNYIERSAQKAEGMHHRIFGKYDISKFEILHINEEVIYMNFFIHQWGHFLLDVIGRLWYAAFINKNCKIVYTCYKGRNDKLQGNYLEVLKLLGISTERLMLVNEVTQFAKVIVPEMSILPGKYYTDEYKKIFDTIIFNALSRHKQLDTTPKKIYCSRSKFSKASFKEKGECKIEWIFEKNQFTPVYMEKMKLEEQIYILNTANEIALINGSLAHNLLFVRSKNKIYIINKTYRCNRHQFLINQLSRVDSTYIDAYVAPLPILYGYGPFLIKITDEFLLFCKINNYNIDDVYRNTKLKISEKIWYYARYLYLYKKFFITGETIKESNNEDDEKSFSSVRKYYHELQK